MSKLMVAAWCLTCAAYAVAAGAPTPQQCQKDFKLSGKTDKQFKDVTLNEWNNMLPAIWVDKGGHFLARVKERGQQSEIHTPSDLQSLVMGGKLEKDKTPPNWDISRVYTKKYTVVFAVNDKSKKCELVTFLIGTP